MKIKWVERHGKKTAYMIRDIDEGKGNADEIGVPVGPPDLDLDWDLIETQLHNALAQKGLLTFGDVQTHPGGLSSAILSVMKKHVLSAYRQQDKQK